MGSRVNSVTYALEGGNNEDSAKISNVRKKHGERSEVCLGTPRIDDRDDKAEVELHIEFRRLGPSFPPIGSGAQGQESGVEGLGEGLIGNTSSEVAGRREGRAGREAVRSPRRDLGPGLEVVERDAHQQAVPEKRPAFAAPAAPVDQLVVDTAATIDEKPPGRGVLFAPGPRCHVGAPTLGLGRAAGRGCSSARQRGPWSSGLPCGRDQRARASGLTCITCADHGGLACHECCVHP